MKKGIHVIVTIIGLILAAVGLGLIKTGNDAQGMMRALPYVCIGVGCGAFGHGLGEIIQRRALKNAQDIQKQMEIEK